MDLKGLPAARLTVCVGVDAFLGDEWQKRKTYAVSSRGNVNRFVTVVELYEAEFIIACVSAKGLDQVEVALKDGSVQEIFLTGMEEGCSDVELHVR